MRPDLTIDERERMRFVGSKFYDILIKPLEGRIEGKKDLVIIPDSILWLIPFETLRLPDGRYLVEKYNVSYIQSLTVSDFLSKRKYSVSDRTHRRAFGGAVYDRPNYNRDMKIFRISN